MMMGKTRSCKDHDDNYDDHHDEDDEEKKDNVL